MPERRNIGVLIDGSFDGLLCVVHAYYYDKIIPDFIVEEVGFQQTLSTDYIKIVTDQEKAGRVFEAIEKKISREALEHLYEVSLHSDPARFMDMFQYAVLGFKVGHMVDNYMKEPYVLAVHKMARYVTMENHKLTGFCRFAETKQGILYAEISPVNNVLPLLANHFSDRLMNEQWIILDMNRSTAAVYDGHQYVISEVPAHVRPQFSEDEERYQKLWQVFFKTIGVENRVNPKLQRNLLPKRYRRHMVEFYQ